MNESSPRNHRYHTVWTRFVQVEERREVTGDLQTDRFPAGRRDHTHVPDELPYQRDRLQSCGIAGLQGSLYRSAAAWLSARS